MRKKNILKILTAGVMAIQLAATAEVWAAPGAAMQNGIAPGAAADSGAQLARERQYMEQLRRKQELEENRASGKVEGEAGQDEKQTGQEIKFHLNKIVTNKSEVFEQQELDKITSEYEGRDVALKDIYAARDAINRLYQEKGYPNCRALLRPQKIRDGVVRLELVEGRTNTVSLRGNHSTNERYIRDRVRLYEGKVANISDLNEDLLRFNATNDAQLHITLKAGEVYGTTDYEIQAFEPQRQTVGFFADNAGYISSGEFRAGVYFQDRSITGNRDSLYLNQMWSKGTKSFAANYVVPVTTRGAKLGLSYSTNAVHITSQPMRELGVKGHSKAYSFSFIQPLVTTETYRSELGASYGRQSSTTDFGTRYPIRFKWVRDNIQATNVYYSQTDYGVSSAFYQKHGYRFGDHDSIDGSSRNFGKYEGSLIYQKVFAGGQQIFIRMDGQFSSTVYLPSAEQFYLGGVYSVRGYEESLLNGDSGFCASAEYAFPVAPKSKWSVYGFVDGGRVYGDTAYQDRSLWSTGLGLRGSILDGKLSVDAGVGFPLNRYVNGVEQDKCRAYFFVNGKF